MKIFVIALIIAICFADQSDDLLVTKAYTDYLKRHVEWEVVSYEENIFRGFTLEEAKMFLGNKPEMNAEPYPVFQPFKEIPNSFDWRLKDPKCIHEVRNQGNCGSCWSFATSGMLADRCCLNSADHGLLAYFYNTR